MKLFKICEGLIINVEHIYALGKEDNQSELDDWDNAYNGYINDIYINPIEFEIDGNLFKPNFNENIDSSILEKYMEKLKVYILSNIGEKPALIESYFTILSSGTKIYLTQEVYNAINNYLESNYDIVEYNVKKT
jgi:hypothetical protein